MSSAELVGGFNPFEKYARQIGSFPQIGVKIKKIELPPPSESLLKISGRNISASRPACQYSIPLRLCDRGWSQLLPGYKFWLEVFCFLLGCVAQVLIGSMD